MSRPISYFNPFYGSFTSPAGFVFSVIGEEVVAISSFYTLHVSKVVYACTAQSNSFFYDFFSRGEDLFYLALIELVSFG